MGVMSLVNLQKATPLINPDAPCPNSHQLSIAPQLGVGPRAPPTPCWNIDRLDLMQVLCRQPPLL